jgi:uncharacterized membrane protein YagU involved in acid resistance
MSALLKKALVVGVGATLVMDVGAALFRALGVTAGTPPHLFAKWLSYIARGQLVHADIAASPDVPTALPAALAVHYAIGIVLSIGWLAVSRRWLLAGARRWAAALAYGLGTIVFAWFLMFPAMGFGPFGANGPEELLLWRTSTINHLLYGLGLALSSRATPGLSAGVASPSTPAPPRGAPRDRPSAGVPPRPTTAPPA